MLETQTMSKNILYILLICSFCACSSPHKGSDKQTILYQTDSLTYAKHFSLKYAQNHTLLTIHNPWNEGQILGKYYLIKHDSISTPTDGTRILIPLKRVCIQSAPHMGYIDALEQSAVVVGACSPQLFYSQNLRTQYQNGMVSHLGDAYQMHLEKITQLNPQAVFVTAYPQADTQTDRLKKLQIPVIPTIEWTEPHLLARAEWIKVFGILMDKAAIADSIFNQTCQHYQALTQLAQSANNKPVIMSGLPFKDTWYMPGGNSFMGQLFKHAGVSYHYSDNAQTSSLPLSFETVWYHFNQADIWVGVDADSVNQLAQMDKRLIDFKPVKRGQVFHYRKRTTPMGGNDFWESAVVYPDKLLHDLMCIAHPTLLPNQETYYIERLP
jgi:iron complex transport system substrate-binding protein